MTMQRKKIQRERKGDERFEGAGGAGVLHWQGDQMGQIAQ